MEPQLKWCFPVKDKQTDDWKQKKWLHFDKKLSRLQLKRALESMASLYFHIRPSTFIVQLAVVRQIAKIRRTNLDCNRWSVRKIMEMLLTSARSRLSISERLDQFKMESVEQQRQLIFMLTLLLLFGCLKIKNSTCSVMQNNFFLNLLCTNVVIKELDKIFFV